MSMYICMHVCIIGTIKEKEGMNLHASKLGVHGMGWREERERKNDIVTL